MLTNIDYKTINYSAVQFECVLVYGWLYVWAEAIKKTREKTRKTEEKIGCENDGSYIDQNTKFFLLCYDGIAFCFM
jgi:hypothetical protein